MTAAIQTPPVLLRTSLGTVELASLGEGPAVLLLHGAMGGYDQGLILGRAAVGCPGYRFVAVSRPGYLGSPAASGLAPERQADLCAAALDALSVTAAAVIAISGGGQCALQFALRHPDRCRALVMLSACSARIPRRPPLRFQIFRLAACIPAVARALQRKAAAHPEAAAARSIPDPVLRERTLSDPEVGPLFQALQSSVMERMAARMPGTYNDIRQSRARFDYPVERIRAPLLVIHGTDDEAAPFAAAQSLAARVPGAELLLIEGGRHVSLFTHNALIRNRVRRFLTDSLAR